MYIYKCIYPQLIYINTSVWHHHKEKKHIYIGLAWFSDHCQGMSDPEYCELGSHHEINTRNTPKHRDFLENHVFFPIFFYVYPTFHLKNSPLSQAPLQRLHLKRPPPVALHRAPALRPSSLHPPAAPSPRPWARRGAGAPCCRWRVSCLGHGSIETRRD